MLKNRKIIIYFIISITFIVWFFRNCTRQSFEIIDNYVVKSEGELVFQYDASRTDGWYLFCNPWCKGDIMVDNVITVYWDKRHLIVEQKEKEASNWFLVVARNEELGCCCRDTTIGPVSKIELDSMLKERNIIVKKMKKKHFKKSSW